MQSTGGSVNLTVPDSVASGENLLLIKTAAEGGGIFAQQNVTLQAGDNVTVPSGTHRVELFDVPPGRAKF